jgi:hypothetical protein
MYRLIYKSCSKTPVDWELVNSIIKNSQKRNAEHDISGALLATKNHFLQVLEGSFEDVNNLFCSIVRDSRHDRVQLVSFMCVENRIFPDWAMHGIGLFNFNLEITKQLKVSFGEENGEVRFPTEEWLALSMISNIRQLND